MNIVHCDQNIMLTSELFRVISSGRTHFYGIFQDDHNTVAVAHIRFGTCSLSFTWNLSEREKQHAKGEIAWKSGQRFLKGFPLSAFIFIPYEPPPCIFFLGRLLPPCALWSTSSQLWIPWCFEQPLANSAQGIRAVGWASSIFLLPLNPQGWT